MTGELLQPIPYNEIGLLQGFAAGLIFLMRWGEYFLMILILD